MTDSSERLHRPEANTVVISDLLAEARAGKFELPELFPRDPEWRGEDRIRLFDSIYRGFPIGSLVFAEYEEPDGSIRISERFGPFQSPARAERPWLVVDGQQRLSALFGCLLVPELDPDPDWHFAFDTENREVVRLGPNPGSELLELPTAVDTVRWLEWARSLPVNDRRDHRMQASEEFSNSLRSYRIPFYVVRTHDHRLLQQVYERTRHRRDRR